MKHIGLELIEVGNYDFPNPCDGPQNGHLFLKRPLADIVFDMPGLHNSDVQIPKHLCPFRCVSLIAISDREY
jgi:hypothetical protein